MADIKTIQVGNNVYKVQGLSVLDTIDLHIDVVESLGETIGKFVLLLGDLKLGRNPSNEEFAAVFKGVNGEKIKPLKKRILAQVITPENKFLGDDVTIEQWFSKPENKADVWGVLYKAADVLLGEYMPDFLKNMTHQGMEKVTAQQELKSQESGEGKP